VEEAGSATDLFEVDSAGSIYVKSGAVLDYEVEKTHTLKVKVYDSKTAGAL
jgi:hypothetical protein